MAKKKSFADTIRDARWAKELTLREVGAAIGVSGATVGNWEQRGFPSHSALVGKLALVLGLDEATLVQQYKEQRPRQGRPRQKGRR